MGGSGWVFLLGAALGGGHCSTLTPVWAGGLPGTGWAGKGNGTGGPGQATVALRSRVCHGAGGWVPCRAPCRHGPPRAPRASVTGPSGAQQWGLPPIWPCPGTVPRTTPAHPGGADPPLRAPQGAQGCCAGAGVTLPRLPWPCRARGCGCAIPLGVGARLPALLAQSPGVCGPGPADRCLSGRFVAVAERGQLPVCPPAPGRAPAEEDGAAIGGEGERGVWGGVGCPTVECGAGGMVTVTATRQCHPPYTHSCGHLGSPVSQPPRLAGLWVLAAMAVPVGCGAMSHPCGCWPPSSTAPAPCTPWGTDVCPGHPKPRGHAAPLRRRLPAGASCRHADGCGDSPGGHGQAWWVPVLRAALSHTVPLAPELGGRVPVALQVPAAALRTQLHQCWLRHHHH